MLTSLRTKCGLIATVTVVVSLLTIHVAAAQTADNWAQLAEREGLFSPHANNCASTEVFISIGGGTAGFCMEKSQRSADYWIGAKETCAGLGKRLPEPAEFQYACLNPPTGLANMTGDNEWASNTATTYSGSSSASVGVPMFGFSSCSDAWVGWVGTSTGSISATPFRCVH